MLLLAWASPFTSGASEGPVNGPPNLDLSGHFISWFTTSCTSVCWFLFSRPNTPHIIGTRVVYKKSLVSSSRSNKCQSDRFLVITAFKLPQLMLFDVTKSPCSPFAPCQRLIFLDGIRILSTKKEHATCIASRAFLLGLKINLYTKLCGLLRILASKWWLA